MKREKYQKPKMKIVTLQHRAHILAGSILATRNDYGIYTVQGWEDNDE